MSLPMRYFYVKMKGVTTMNFIKVPDAKNKPMLINLEEVAYIKTDNNGDAWIRMRNGEAVVTLIFTPIFTPILRKKYSPNTLKNQNVMLLNSKSKKPANHASKRFAGFFIWSR